MEPWLSYDYRQNGPVPQQTGHVEQQENGEENMLLFAIIGQSQEDELMHLCLVLQHCEGKKDKYVALSPITE